MDTVEYTDEDKGFCMCMLEMMDDTENASEKHKYRFYQLVASGSKFCLNSPTANLHEGTYDAPVVRSVCPTNQPVR